MLGGALFVTWGYLHGNIALSSLGPTVAAAMDFLINTLLLVGLGGLCTWWWEGRTDWLGAGGFVVGFAGAALSVTHSIHALISESGTAELAPWYVYVLATTGLPPKVFSWFPTVPIGMAIVGIGSIRTEALGGWGFLPLVVGLSGEAYKLTDSGGVFRMGNAHLVIGVVYGLSWVLLGCLIWPKRSGPNRHNGPR